MNVLVVDDNKFDLELTSRKLGYLDSIHQLIYLMDGDDAVDYLFQTGKYQNTDNYIKPDFILLDIAMPKLNGTEVLQKIKDDGSPEIKKIPVIVLSNSQDKNTNNKCFKLGARGFLKKPIQIELLKDLLISFGLVK